ncbi:MAG TPA: hypothetical protein ENJ09_15055 [Planctomycetes bacterium]|nr:hypothetical protein [Planctomycetota bacterium]
MELVVLILVPVFAALAAVTFLLWKLLKGVSWVLGGILGRVFSFVRSELVECVQVSGALLTIVVLSVLTLLNFLIGRWGTARHYVGAMEDEAVSSALGLYRIALAHPFRLVGLAGLLDGLERRLPQVVERAPRRVRKGKVGTFEGYDVIGTLPPGGSGAQLFVARPRPETVQRLARPGTEVPAEVVIKSFALQSGSTLPQIVRESRALEAAKRLGLVLEHHLDPERFYYVMEYVRGDDLGIETQRLHQRSGPEGLRRSDLDLVLSYTIDVLRSLERFHSGGLWHKDVKPTNVIVSQGRAHLVDFGLVTSLSSALTLTTHGTEYYRDPEMVRLAMKGVKVHEVDGVKFDLYSTGALLYSMIENSFPAHGSLSSLSKRCPEALAWVVRRAMADIDSRYASAGEMLADLHVIAASEAPETLRPADLPSVRGEAGADPGAHWNRASGADAGPEGESRFERRFAESMRKARAASNAAFTLLADERRRRRDRSSRYASAFARRYRAPRPRRFPRGIFVAAAVLFFVAAPLACVASLLLPVSGVHSQGPIAAVTVRESAQATAELAREMAYSVREGVSSSVSRGPRSVAPPVDPYPGVEGARVLVLDDLAHAAGRLAVEREEGRLEESGARILDPGSTDVLSAVMFAVGTGSQGDPDARQRLQAYLDSSADLDAVLWLAEDRAPDLLVRDGFRVP